MEKGQGKTDNSNGSKREKGKPSKMEAAEACRCKEVSKKKWPDLLRLMLRDMAFWKKKGN